MGQAACGPVVTDKGAAGWHGAERGTNNTAELTAILQGLRWAGGLADTVVRIRYDSEYAANTARGLWKAKKRTGSLKPKIMVSGARLPLGSVASLFFAPATPDTTVEAQWLGTAPPPRLLG